MSNGHGGKRAGAGRKKGSSTNPFRLALRESATAERIALLAEQSWDHVEKGDKEMLKYMWDQLAGRPAQQVEMKGEMSNPLSVYLIEKFGEDNDKTS